MQRATTSVMKGRYIRRFGIWKMSYFLTASLSSVKYDSFTTNGSKEILEDCKSFEWRRDVSEEREPSF